MLEIENLKKEIVKRLEPLEPDRIILFGSPDFGHKKAINAYI